MAENATGTLTGVPTGTPGVFQYTITLTDTGDTTIGTFWFAWDDLPDQDFMTAQPANLGAPANWSAFVTPHFYAGGTGYGIEWIASSVNARLNPGDTSSAFTFTSTETPAQMAAVSPFDNTFQTTSSFVYQGGAFATTGGIPVVAVACFREGTHIRTPAGDVAVETLRAGDLVLTASGAKRPVRWTGHRRVHCAMHEHPETTWPICVAKDALEPGVPYANLYISPDHALFLDGVLVPVKHLVNGTTIARVPADAVTWHHLELDSHDVVLAEGAPSESYLDTGDRAKFDTAAVTRFPRLLLPAEADAHSRFIREANSDLELIVAGAVLESIRRRLDERGGWLTESSRRRNAA